MVATEHYILFPNVSNGLKLSELLKTAQIDATIVPTPREASKCCGISLLVNHKKDLPAIKELIKQNDIEIIAIFELAKTRDPQRDRYC